MIRGWRLRWLSCSHFDVRLSHTNFWSSTSFDVDKKIDSPNTDTRPIRHSNSTRKNRPLQRIWTSIPSFDCACRMACRPFIRVTASSVRMRISQRSWRMQALSSSVPPSKTCEFWLGDLQCSISLVSLSLHMICCLHSLHMFFQNTVTPLATRLPPRSLLSKVRCILSL